MKRTNKGATTAITFNVPLSIGSTSLGKPRPIIIEYFGNNKKFAEKLEKLLKNQPENMVLKSYSHGDGSAENGR